MTEQKANEIFRTKYPNGEIGRKYSTSAESKYWVVFDKSQANHKAYYYSATSYQALLGRFGFNIAYKHDIAHAEACLEKYEQELQNGYEKFFCTLLFYKPTEQEWREQITAKIEEQREYVRYLKEDCILG